MSSPSEQDANENPVVPPLRLAPRKGRSSTRRRHSLGDAKSFFSRSMKNLTGNNKNGESRTPKNPLRKSRSSSNGLVSVAPTEVGEGERLNAPLSPRDPTASPRVLENVNSFFTYYYEKHPLSRADQEAGEDTKETKAEEAE